MWGEGFTCLEVTGDAGVEHFNFQHPFLMQTTGTIFACICTYPEILNEDPS